MREKMLELIAALAATLMTRWLLDLSTPRRDWRDLMATGWFDHLSWWRGGEAFHQVRAWRLLKRSYGHDAD